MTVEYQPAGFYILDIGRDNLGAYLKVRVAFHSDESIIRWGLDAYTFERLRSVLTEGQWTAATFAEVVLETTYEKTAGHVGLLHLQLGSDHVTRRFLCSDLFASNVAWLRKVRNKTELSGMTWDSVIATSTSSSDVEARHYGAKHGRRWPSRTALMGAVCVLASLVIAEALHVRNISAQTHQTALTKSGIQNSIAFAAHPSTSNDEDSNFRVHETLPPSEQNSPSVPNAEKGAGNGTEVQATPLPQNGNSTVSDEKIVLTGTVHLPEIYGVANGDVALTFDDGPSQYTDDIVSILHQHGVNATFFFVGNRIPMWPNAVKEATSNGDVVGDHSEDHPVLTTLSAVNQTRQITTAAMDLESHGSSRVTLFRPPYGVFNNTTESVLKTQDMTLALWNRDPRDWSAKTVADVVNGVLGDHPSGGVFDLHENALTTEALPAIIEGLQKQGLKLVVLQPPTS